MDSHKRKAVHDLGQVYQQRADNGTLADYMQQAKRQCASACAVRMAR